LFIPLRPENFRVQRLSDQAVLTWVDGDGTTQMNIEVAQTERAVSTTQQVVAAGVHTTTVTALDPEQTYTFQLVPVGETGIRGRASYVVYAPGNPNLDPNPPAP
ncbi:fibronectin type III domain-containing protein, partial [Arthrospira platensis SPKY1]|nr:fibronectin type III domain-containing protein [Arthrospira platensis SPKY1]